MNRRSQIRCMAAIVFALFASVLNAQVRGTISGYVRDASSAVVPDASVRLVNEGTGASRDTTTNVDGFYQFLGLAPARIPSRWRTGALSDLRTAAFRSQSIKTCAPMSSSS